ncbi:hypothetical protein SAMN05421827_102155 [Pedobacter terrae]|uniref:Uncharacterized protein n=1 Tax=Pedobacter terrae TaxID=405671 RepID=A0A1G7Q3N6_9SPHI|nr:hypothetical protein [Pedobacter terrae]SDF93104.1 hypothetical protein SAMN05421827_102155 [Pedobacter terrae]
MREQGKSMQPFEMDIDQDGERKTIRIQQENGVFEIIHDGRVIGALRPPGEEWQLLDYSEITRKIALFEPDLESEKKGIELHSPLVNQIVGEIENHLK